PGTPSGGRRLSLAWLGVLPFFAYALAFLFIPAGEVIVGAFKNAHGGATLHHMHQIVQQPYRDQYWLTIKVSLITAGVGSFLGLCIAYAMIREGTPRFLRTILTTLSGVAANFADSRLAVALIATLGIIGLATRAVQVPYGPAPSPHFHPSFGP